MPDSERLTIGNGERTMRAALDMVAPTLVAGGWVSVWVTPGQSEG